MREIKFRGKRVDNGEWVYGFFRKLMAYGKYSNEYEEHETSVISWIDENEVNRHSEVIPETVGQFTGLKDKNGKEIYEGDIVEAWSQGVKAKGEVKQRIDGYWLMFPAWQSGEFWALAPNQNGETTVKILGNIHESPELLGK